MTVRPLYERTCGTIKHFHYIHFVGKVYLSLNRPPVLL